MSRSPIELTELVCTRLSHDLIGSIGAVSGALELIEEENGQLDDDTKNILRTGTDTLKARQKFFRQAFGLDSKKMLIADTETLCREYLATVGSRANPISLELKGINSELSKIACLGVMIASEVYIKGGQITVSVDSNYVRIIAQSDYKLASGKLGAYQEIIKGKSNVENESQYVQLIYLKEMLGDNVPFTLNATETQMELIIG